MKTLTCPNCHLEDPTGKEVRRTGRYFRHSTNSWVKRYYCRTCKAGFSEAIFEDGYRQKKRNLNPIISNLLAHLVSQREVARLLKINYKTVVRKFRHQAMSAEYEFVTENNAKPRAFEIEFDDLETFEISKHLPLSVPIVVERTTRRILGLEVAEMPIRGRLAKKAREKYGRRLDLRQKARKMLFARLATLVHPVAEIRSDQNPSYPFVVKKFFPNANHKRFKGRRGCVTGQGELKAGRYDPLFSINHTCAMFRANVNRLIRRTWCTTKSMDRLRCHLKIYANEHNKRLDEISRLKLMRAG